MKSLKPKPYHPFLYQGLLEDDFNRHVEFTEWYGIRNEADHNFHDAFYWRMKLLQTQRLGQSAQPSLLG